MDINVKYPIVKLDRRFAGAVRFTHMIDLDKLKHATGKTNYSWCTLETKQTIFTALRIWFWEQHGPSSDLRFFQIWSSSTGTSLNWAWEIEHNKLRIYLTGDVLTHFLMMQTT